MGIGNDGISLTFDTSVLARKFTSIEREQIPFAMALTLSWTARDMAESVRAGLSSAFDRPTPFTMQSIFVRGASKNKLVAYVFIRDEASKGTPPVKYLAPGVYGGHRRAKRFEKALRNAGVLGPNEIAIPGSGAVLDSYGNVGAGTITRILSQLHASPDPAQNTSGSSRSKRSRRRNPIFVPRPGSPLRRGIWARDGKGIKMIFLFAPDNEVNYPKRFRFFEIAESTFSRTFRNNWQSAFSYAMKTMKVK